MPQTSVLFLVFCAAVVAVYWLVPRSSRDLFLAVSSTLFLIALDSISYALLLTLTILIYHSAKSENRQKLYPVVFAGIVFLFCGVRVVQLFQRFDHGQHWLVFLGFGFYTLKLLHYRIEMQSGSFREHTFLAFYNYMLFFPTVTIGPIHRFEDFQKSSKRVRWEAVLFSNGLERILYGYAKVIILADWLISVHIMGLAARVRAFSSALGVLVDSTIYGFHLYFTFAGYSDIAIGLSLLLGYHICENFNWPFVKKNIAEFWQSWHMSLSAWCRQYVFLPIYSKYRSLSFAMIAAMVTLGLWHEFSARFLLWGIYHGIGLGITRWYQRSVRVRFPVFRSRIWTSLAYATCVTFTFLFVVVGFTIPRSASVSEIITNFRTMLGI